MSTTDIGHFINGTPVAGQGQRTQAVTNPATGAVTGKVVLADKQDVNTAVAAAQAAFPAWADAPPLRRARVMFKFLELLHQHKDALAHAITAEHGKVFTDAQGIRVPADAKSLAYSLTYRAADRTLTADEVNAAHSRLKQKITSELGVTARE